MHLLNKCLLNIIYKETNCLLWNKNKPDIARGMPDNSNSAFHAAEEQSPGDWRELEGSLLGSKGGVRSEAAQYSKTRLNRALHGCFEVWAYAEYKDNNRFLVWRWLS